AGSPSLPPGAPPLDPLPPPEAPPLDPLPPPSPRRRALRPCATASTPVPHRPLPTLAYPAPTTTMPHRRGQVHDDVASSWLPWASRPGRDALMGAHGVRENSARARQGCVSIVSRALRRAHHG